MAGFSEDDGALWFAVKVGFCLLLRLWKKAERRVVREKERRLEEEQSSSVTELERWRRTRESAEELPLESREAAAVLVPLEDEVGEERRRARSKERRGERWRGRSCPL